MRFEVLFGAHGQQVQESTQRAIERCRCIISIDYAEVPTEAAMDGRDLPLRAMIKSAFDIDVEVDARRVETSEA